MLNLARGSAAVAAAPTPVKRSAEECDAEAASALAAIGAHSRRSLFCNRQQSALEAIVREYDAYLAELTRPGRDTWDNCTPIEVQVFFEAHWLESHRGVNGGDVVPSTLRKAVSMLRRAFNMRGRTGPYISLPQTAHSGNPCDHPDIEDFLTTYDHDANEAGVKEVSATPLPAADYERLMHGLERDIVTEWAQLARGCGNAQTATTLGRDAAAFSLMWGSARRASDVLEVSWDGAFAADFQRLPHIWGEEVAAGCSGHGTRKC